MAAQDTIRTDRLVMSPPDMRDVAAVFDLTSDVRTVEHTPSDRLRTSAEAEAYSGELPVVVGGWMRSTRSSSAVGVPIPSRLDVVIQRAP